MHAITNTYDWGKQELTVMKLTRGDFSIFVYVLYGVEVQVLPHCVAPPKCANIILLRSACRP